MKQLYEEIPFPAINKISFDKLFDTLENLKNDDNKHIAQYANGLIKDLKPYPILREGFEDLSVIEEHREQVNALCRLLFPDALLNNEIKGIIPPMQFKIFYSSTRFSNILKRTDEDFTFELKDFDLDKIYIMGCSFIMQKHYLFPIDPSRPFTVEIPDTETGRTHFYRIAFNADLIDIEPTERSHDITHDDYLELMDNFDDIKLWKKKFPPNSWIMKGIAIMNLMDITVDHASAEITSNLLVKGSESLDKIQDNLRVIFNIDELRFGFVEYNGKHLLQRQLNFGSFILKKKDECIAKEIFNEAMHKALVTERKTFAISDMELFTSKQASDLGKSLLKQGIKSYLIVPIEYEGKILGFMELASPEKYHLNSISIAKMARIVPIISMAVGRLKSEAANHIEAVIQQECTTIHPSVKWRFEEEACRYMDQEAKGHAANFRDIIFRDVYPLYGQMDVKGSSDQRNKAVIKDLVTQLNTVQHILKDAYADNALPLLEELIFRIEQFIKTLNDGLSAGSEFEIMSFLKNDVYPVFEHLKSTRKSLAKLIGKYQASLSKDLGILYDARKAFDDSVMQANHMMATFLDKRQREAQSMFPHYFERYKTDGVEYNIYVGQSILKEGQFNDLYLRNLRLWQLITMCQMEHKFKALQKDLQTPLEVASLILVYNSPLSIHFRMDEKRFDVEGAYNARYEIVKKRVDKAHILGTEDRITVPEKISIIYSSDEDSKEYLKYMDYLEVKGYIKKGSLELHDLEDLQGISGLKAMRVEVNYEDKAYSKEGVTFDELVSSLK